MLNIFKSIVGAIASVYTAVFGPAQPPLPPTPPPVVIEATTTIEIATTSEPVVLEKKVTPKTTFIPPAIVVESQVIVKEEEKTEEPKEEIHPTQAEKEAMEYAEALEKETDRLNRLQAKYYKDKAILQSEINQVKIKALADIRATESSNGTPLAIIQRQQEQIRLEADRQIFDLETQLEQLRLEYNEEIYK